MDQLSHTSRLPPHEHYQPKNNEMCECLFRGLFFRVCGCDTHIHKYDICYSSFFIFVIQYGTL